jgi:hypothetical protein
MLRDIISWILGKVRRPSIPNESFKEMREKWIEHCRQAGHITQSDAYAQGKGIDRYQYATYRANSQWTNIYCELPDCDWKFRI